MRIRPLASILVIATAFAVTTGVADASPAPSSPAPASPPVRTEAPPSPRAPATITRTLPPRGALQVVNSTSRTVHSVEPNGARDTKNEFTVHMTGLQRGTSVQATMQTRSVTVELPPGVERIDAPTAAERKEENRVFNKTLAGNVAKANQEKVLFDETVTVAGRSDYATVNENGELPPSAPLAFHARDSYGRTLPTVYATAGTQGISRRDAQGQVLSYDQVKGGAYEAWAVKENLFSTPAFERDGKTFSKFLGLAAFPRSARVVLTNTRLRSERASNYSTIVDLSTAGAGAAEVPALEGDRIEIALTMPGATQVQRFYYDVPAPTKQALGAARLKTNGGIPYLAVANFQDPAQAAPTTRATASKAGAPSAGAASKASSNDADAPRPGAIRRALGWFSR